MFGQVLQIIFPVLSEKYSFKEFKSLEEIRKNSPSNSKEKTQTNKSQSSNKNENYRSSSLGNNFLDPEIKSIENSKKTRKNNNLSNYPQSYYSKFFIEPNHTPYVKSEKNQAASKKYIVEEQKQSQSILKNRIKELLSKYKLPKVRTRSSVSNFILYNSGVPSYKKQ